ncbi:MAG TPA: ATP-binding protein [Thermomicrobiales bacterium]|nr:ATP-binding protein [Thermomicrobiales bacterium]
MTTERRARPAIPPAPPRRRGVAGLWRRVRAAYRQRLSWKLTLSHLVVILLCLVVLVAGFGLLLTILQTYGAQTHFPQVESDMSQETRILAVLLAEPVRTRTPDQLSALLRELPPRTDNGSGPFGGSLSPNNLLVVVAPGGTVLAASNTTLTAPGTRVEALRPAVWAPLLRNALGGETRMDAGRLSAGDPGMRVLVTAYPIVDGQGRVIGALGLRSAPVPLGSPGLSPSGILVRVIALLLLVLALAAVPAALVSTAAGFLVARGFARRLAALEEAAAAFARGDLARRVAVRSPDEIGRLSARFNELAERLEAVERARRAFVSNVSHELRTPLAIVRGHVEAQLQPDNGAALPPAAREALEVIDREARTLAGLVDDLFTVTRLEEAALPLAPEPVALPAAIEAVVAGLRPLAREQGHIALSALAPPDLPPALADRTRLDQILKNLLYNALRHTPPGGVIVVEAAPAPDGRMVEVRVTDTGAGIPPDELPFVFERFYQAENGARRPGSSGLGLAIVKQLVEAQGGTVGAASAPDEGTSIRFTLPAAGP